MKKRILAIFILVCMFATLFPKNNVVYAGNGFNGVLDYIDGKNGQLRLYGWSYDTDNTGASMILHVFIGGPTGAGEGHVVNCNTYRPDVNSAHGISGLHGFDVTINTNKRGWQPIYIYQINTNGSANALWHTKDIYINYKTYNITYRADGGTGIPAPQTKTEGQDLRLSYAVPQKNGYIFQKWWASNALSYSPGSLYTRNESTVLAPEWKPITYSVKYDANGGDAGSMENSSHIYDSSKELNKNKFSRIGYTFAGWSLDRNAITVTYADGANVKNLSSANNSTVTLYAIWKPNSYSVAFNGNGSDKGVMANQIFSYPEVKTLTSNGFSKKGYHFIGWSSDVNGSTVEYEQNHSVSKLIGEENGIFNLYAVWSPNTYTITFNSNGADVDQSNVMADMSCLYDSIYTLPENTYVKEGHSFLGWSTDINATAAMYIDKAEIKNLTSYDNTNIIFYAVWKKLPETADVEFNETSYYGGKKLALISGTPDATIYYTIDGTVPDTTSLVYYEPLDFNVVQNTTVKAIAYKENYKTSNVTVYDVIVGATPEVTFSLNSTDVGKNLEILCRNDDAQIYYTLNGTTPDDKSLLYVDGISFNTKTSTTVKAFSVASGCVASELKTYGIFVDEVSAPIISISEEWVGGAMIKLSSDTINSNIYYTLDGTDPLTSGSSKLYSEEFEINEDAIIYAIAKKNGYSVSAPSYLYVKVRDREVYQPYISSENIINGKRVILACETPDAGIYYTLDGTEPSIESTRYIEPFELAESTTIRAVAIYDDITGPELTKQVEIPQMLPPLIETIVGENTTRVQITGQTTNSTIYYTTDGEYPTVNSAKYISAFEVSQKTQIRAVAVRKGYINSELSEAEAIVLSVTVPSVETMEAQNITNSSAVLNGNLLSNGGSELTCMKFLYYEKNNPDAIYTLYADSEFKATVSNLKPSTEYWFQAIAGNSKGYANGLIKSFRTLDSDKVNVSQIKLSPEFSSMTVGSKKTILATVLPENAEITEIAWTSNNTDVARVDSNGCVEAISPGDATITAVAAGSNVKGTMEISVVNGEINGEFDFSEIAMAKNVSAVWNPSNQEETYAIDSVIVGGNAVMATAYLARWGGAVLESKDPYPSSIAELNTKQSTPDFHVQDVVFLPPRQNSMDNNDIKNAIMEYGAVYAQFKLDQNYFTSDLKNYYLPPDKASNASGHAIAIVGWDDNYSYLKFKKNNRPAGNGAFICKNSWGTHDESGYEIGENGYFYISYYDPFLGNYGINSVFNNIEVSSNYENIHQYDPLGPILSKEYDDKVYIANVFPKNGEGLPFDQTLSAVSFYTADKGIAYEIYVIPDFNSEDFFEELGMYKAHGVMEYAGYHTVKINERLELKEGSRFAVVVKLSSSTGKVSTYFEAPLASMASQYAKAGENESFISIDGSEWTDVHLEVLPNTNNCIKAFTNRIMKLTGVNPDLGNGNVVILPEPGNNEQNSSGDENVEIELPKIETTEKVVPEVEMSEIVSIDEAVNSGFVINEEYITEVKNNESSISLFEEPVYGTGASSPSIVIGNNAVNNTEGIKFPATYDLRNEGNCLSSVKNQGILNTCWAFATYASLESCIMKKAHGIKYYDVASGSSAISTVLYSSIRTPVTDIQIHKDKVSIAKGNTDTLYVQIVPANATDKNIIWNSSNSSIVSVDTSGAIRALEIGEATITATNQSNGLSASCVVTVTEPAAVTGITSDITGIVCNEGDLFMIDYEITPENAGERAVEITFADDIATVSGGLITAVKSGETTITVTTVDGGHSITIPLTVLASENIDTPEQVLIEYAEITDTGILADIINENSNDVNCEIYIATYDKMSKKLISVKSEEITVPAGDIFSYSADIEVPVNHAVKIFVWKKDNISPICNTYEIN